MSTNAIEKVSYQVDILPKKDYINLLRLNAPKVGVLFIDFIQDYIARKSKRLSGSCIENYTTVLNHLYEFSRLNNATLYTNSINAEFLDDFILYLEDRNVTHNYIASLLTQVKGLTKQAAESGYAVDHTYKDVEMDLEDVFSIYLSSDDITRIYYFKGLTKKQAEIRDLFVLGCLTALRYSDYSTLTKENFVDGMIVKTTKKTKKRVIIPMHKYVKEIYERYDGAVSKGLSNQHFNRYIKKICQMVGFDEKISYSYRRGGQLVFETKEKWELISSHTARRSAATNMYITGRMKTYQIMAVTGHTTERSFFRYIKVTQEDAINQIMNDQYFKG